MKVKVIKRFSVRGQDGKLNFFEVGNRDIEEEIGEQAIGLEYAIKVSESNVKQETTSK